MPTLLPDHVGGLRPRPLPSQPTGCAWLVPEPVLRDIHHAARCVETVLERLPWLRRHDPRVRDLLALGEEESKWLERYAHPPGRNSLLTRLDARLGHDGAFVFLEANGVAAASLAWAEPFPPLCDARELLVSELQARAFARPHPHVALLGDLEDLAEYLRARGFTARVAEPEELQEGLDGEILLHGRAVDVVLRDLELRELVALEASRGRLAGLRAAFERGLVIPGTPGDLDCKATFELMSSPEFEPFVRDQELEACRRHVAWTRLLTERRTTGRRDEPIDLPRYVLRRREELVLKPDRASGGEGVVLGPLVSQKSWEAAVETALQAEGAWVVQSYQAPVQAGFVQDQTRYLAAGVFATVHGLAILGSASATPVVSPRSGAAVVPVAMAT